MIKYYILQIVADYLQKFEVYNSKAICFVNNAYNF